MAQKLRKPNSYSLHPVVNVDDIREVVFENVKKLFSDVDLNYLKDVILAATYEGQRSIKTVMDIVITDLTENDGYPRIEPWMVPKSNTPDNINNDSRDSKNYFLDYGDYVTIRYKTQCIWLLKNDFRYLQVRLIVSTAQKFNYHYAPARHCLTLILKNILQMKSTTGNDHNQQFKVLVTVGNVIINDRVVLLKTPRAYEVFKWRILPALKKEKEFIDKQIKTVEEEEDRKIALHLNQAEYENCNQLIECGCCYGLCMFEMLVQCYEGHLFCSDCILAYIKESVFGNSSSKLSCLSDGCEESFPINQLKKALPPDIWAQFEKRTRQESLNVAQIENLVSCPYCEYACILESSEKVFHCYNPMCLRETCRLCHEDWGPHFGLPCKEVEKKEETRSRIAMEERMTEARTRICSRCKSRFAKIDGCNKIYCRCGATMCYICRSPDISYQHFCNHGRQKNKPCTKCNNTCILWTDAEEDEKRALVEIKKAARKLLGEDN